MMTVVVIEEDVRKMICGYDPQSGRSLEEKQSFHDELKCEWDIHSADDIVMCLCDINGHVGRHIDWVHGGNGVGQRNLEERMLFVLSGERITCQISGLREMKTVR